MDVKHSPQYLRKGYISDPLIIRLDNNLEEATQLLSNLINFIKIGGLVNG